MKNIKLLLIDEETHQLIKIKAVKEKKPMYKIVAELIKND